jgi:hypothetical protein
MTKLGMLERALFVTFVVAADAFALGILPALGVATFVCLFAFVFLEEHVRSGRYRPNCLE